MDKIYKKYQGHTIENWISETSPDFKKFAGYVYAIIGTAFGLIPIGWILI